MATRSIYARLPDASLNIWPNLWPNILTALGLLLASAVACAQAPILSGQARHHPVFAKAGMVATQESRATAVGVDILRRGGNAVDAAVAVGFALAVTLPRAGNLGGGGFMLVHRAGDSKTVAIDYRESAPAKASRDMYLTAAGEVDKSRARYSHKSVGVPGTVAGLLRALHEFGSMTPAEVIAPALALAQYGIVVTPTLAQGLERRAKRMQRWPNTRNIFYKPDGSFYQTGDLLVQTDLAWSLRQIAHHGEAAFYKGAIAKRLVEEMVSNGGLIEAQDLAAYRVIVREPVWGEYRGFKVASMPPPSSGGVHLVQILNVLEGYPIAHLGHNSASTMHLMAEAMRYAYADRSKHLGDPSFHAVPVAGLVSKAYARTIRAKIDQHRATPSTDVAPGKPSKYESRETTHFSIMDRKGNVVSNTYTINFSFGTGIVAGGTGILLNNEMDDFSAKPGVANAYGLLGGEANAIEAGKRPLSSMTPTIVFKDGKPFFATGTPGGSRIITTTLQLVMNVIDHGMNIAQATAAPRMHHQWFPDELRIEQGVSPDTVAALSRLGHKVVTKRSMGSAQTVMRDGPWFMGASDPRRPGAWAAGLAQ